MGRAGTAQLDSTAARFPHIGCPHLHLTYNSRALGRRRSFPNGAHLGRLGCRGNGAGKEALGELEWGWGSGRGRLVTLYL